jgi:hypothetical protein
VRLGHYLNGRRGSKNKDWDLAKYTLTTEAIEVEDCKINEHIELYKYEALKNYEN